MKKTLVVNILSLLASFLFPLTAVLGMLLGQVAIRIFSAVFSSNEYGQIGGEFVFFTFQDITLDIYLPLLFQKFTKILILILH